MWWRGGRWLYFAKAKLRAVSLLLKNLWSNVICEYASEPGYRNVAIWIKLGKPLFSLVVTPSKNSLRRRSHTHISHSLTDFRAKERLFAVYAKDYKGFLSPTVIVQPRPQGAFPWLWRWEKRPGDEVAHRCYSLCTDPPSPLLWFLLRGGGSLHRLHCYCHLIKQYVLLRYNKEMRDKTLHLIPITLRCMLNRKRTKTIFLRILVFHSQGYLEYSFLFYGYYGNEYIHVGAVKYPLPLAYFVVFMGTYLFSIIIVLRA